MSNVIYINRDARPVMQTHEVVLRSASHPYRHHWSYRWAVRLWQYFFPPDLTVESLEEMTIEIRNPSDVQ